MVWTISVSATLYGFTAKFRPSEPKVNLENVSGYYGPGAYLAWYLTACSLGVRLILHKSPSSEDCKGEEDEPPRMEISGDVLATVVYPIVALIDTTAQFCYSIVKGTPFSAEFLAGLYVLEIASTTAYFVEYLDRDPDGPRRHWTIRLLHTANTFLGYGSIFQDRSLVRPWYLGCKIIHTVMVSGDRHLYHDNRRVRPLIFGVNVIALHIVRLRLPPYKLLPVTTCKLSDLDQLAAFISAVAALLFPWKEQIVLRLQLLWEYVFHHKYNVSDLVSQVISKILRRRQLPDHEATAGISPDVYVSG